MSTSIPNQQPAPTSTEVLAASIALAVERQLTDYMASVSRQIADLRTALDATRVELRAELHGEWKSALDTMHRELDEHAQQSPTVVTTAAEPQPAPTPAFDPAVIQNELDAVRGEFHVELVDRISTLESKITEDMGAKLAALEVAIGRSGAGFDEAVAAVSRRLHELDDATHSLLGRIDQLDARVGATDNSGIDQLKEQLSSALGEVMLVRIDIDRAVASTEDKIGKATLRMAEIEALLSDEMDVSSAVQLERLDEIERAIAELDPNHVISTVPAAAPAAMPAPAPELAPSPAPPVAPHAAPAPEITDVPAPDPAHAADPAPHGQLIQTATDDMALFKTSKDTTPASEGESGVECMKVGQSLVEGGHLDATQLATTLAAANGDLLLFADTLQRTHAVPRHELAVALSEATGVAAVDTKGIVIPDALKGVLAEDIVRQHCAVAVAEDGDALVILCSDPAPKRRVALETAAGRPVKFVLSDPTTVRTFIDLVYRATADVDRLVRSLDLSDDQAKLAAIAAEVNLDDQAPVIQLVNRIVSQAMRDRASDIHIEPMDEDLRVRFRIDGHLVEAFRLPMGAHAALISRLKIMSGMNIVEKRRPQDGQFSTVIDTKEVDVRVASVATVFGEKIVMRILDKGRSMIGLAELGFPRETYLHYSKMIHSPFGMVICAGPTGAGKTTTLYASLLEVNDTGKNITTVEDPVEYVFPGINQIQTNDQAGLTFATGLKAILRQDPDVILVGEIRDADTARIAVQSALTGHLVLSSLHGTDSVAALHRFLDMGIEAFLIASSVVGVIGQRLLRRICDSCKEPYTPGAEELALFRQHTGGSEKVTFYHGVGCNFCANTGYRDRIGVYELLRITPELRRLIVGWATTEELRRLAVAQGMRTMLREAMALVESDVTTIPEVIKTLFAS